jgi:sigma-54 dependent transcriptional regulator, acetoin dehydrogenase operon transcriptional activator AcoR
LMTGICERFGIRPKRVADDALDILGRYEWRRNNVRELRNVVERMIIGADDLAIRAEHVPAEIRGEHVPDHSYQALRQAAERRIVIDALERNDWHITRAAEELGLADHASLLKIMRRLGVERPA